jgi:hypothetical protein
MGLNTDLIDEESLHCLTLFVRNDNATIINCLQLELLKPSLRDYKRVVLLKVSLDLKYTLLQEIKWIAEYVNSEPDSRDLVKVTIF